MWLRSIGYRLGQVRQQLGFVASLSEADHQEVAGILLSAAAQSLFRTMSPADQQHSLRVCRGLQARGCTDKDMLAAALLHDIGKSQGRVPFWTRPTIVIGKKLAPNLLSRLVLSPQSVGAGEDEVWGGDACVAHVPLSTDSGNPGMRDNPTTPTGRTNPRYRIPHGAERNSSMVGAIPCDRPARIGDRPAHMDDRPETANDRPTHADGHPARVGGRLAQIGDRSARADGRPETANDRPTRAGDRPETANDRPAHVGDRPETAGDRPTCADGSPETANGRPAGGRGHSTLTHDHPTPPIPKWRQSLSNAWYHADIGAQLASAAGLSDRAVLYIRTHHQPDGPAAALYEVDEVS